MAEAGLGKEGRSLNCAGASSSTSYATCSVVSSSATLATASKVLEIRRLPEIT